ncbi:U3 small nucleolar ribonucleoprotein complex, subunit Mpp10 [Gorgonomyces haynaldii]|nr:U3 small nucleolar ribonucleoprotein complex, subunit Mpp10 [Gorgonomyces haynaldii]
MNAVDFLIKNDAHVQEWLKKCSELFKQAKSVEPVKTPLDVLYVDGFDLDGVWSQLELLNEPAVAFLEQVVKDHLPQESEQESEPEEQQEQVDAYNSADEGESDAEALDQEVSQLSEDQELDEEEIEESFEDVEQDFEEGIDEFEQEMEEFEEDIGDMDEEEMDEFEEEMDEELPVKDEEHRKKKSIVDDEFFSLEDMERFADLGEARDMKMSKISTLDELEDEDDEDIFSIGKDLNAEVEEENANDIRYEDFFVAKKSDRQRKSWKDDIAYAPNQDKRPEREEPKKEESAKKEDLFEEEENIEQGLSKFEREQLKIKKQIQELEQEAVAEKKWTLKGEVNSTVRPVNSLLEEDLEFEAAAKPVPVITEETTRTLDDMIVQRIKDEAWDDVVRKAPPKNTVFDPNRRFELLDEKSSKSLAQIYEEDYKQKAMGQEIKSEKTLELEQKHQEVEQLLDNLFRQLDALSNYHYAPQDATMELQVAATANVPAISLEEVIPATVSDAMLAAPKEVYDGQVKKSQEEMDASDKKKARVKAKRIASKERKERERAKKLQEKEQPTQAQMTKQTAIKKLMNQSNVTIIADQSNKEQLKDKKRANVIEKGGQVKKQRVEVRPEMLRL